MSTRKGQRETEGVRERGFVDLNELENTIALFPTVKMDCEAL